MVSSELKKRILRLASSTPGQGDASSPAWPYDVDFVLSEGQSWTVGLSEGVGHGAGGRVTEEELVEDYLSRHGHLPRVSA